jgi:hypothetical protein
MKPNAAVAALAAKRTDMLGKRDELERSRAELHGDLEAGERVIRLVDPEHEFSDTPRRRGRATADLRAARGLAARDGYAARMNDRQRMASGLVDMDPVPRDRGEGSGTRQRHQAAGSVPPSTPCDPSR